jgi:hypothetical protein
MLEGDSTVSRSSVRPDRSALDLSREDFHASDVGSIIFSYASHLCSVSNIMGLSESDGKASDTVPRDQVTTERSSKASNLGGENDILREKTHFWNNPLLIRGRWTNQSQVADQLPTINSTITCVDFCP